MKKLIQNSKTGVISIEEIAAPICKEDGILVSTSYSLISTGTEKTSVSTAKASIINKAKKRPDLVKKVLKNVKDIGLQETLKIIKNRLDAPMELGYSCSGEVIEVGENVKTFSVGDKVACAGGGYASHSEINYIPKNLAVKIPKDVSLKEACYGTAGAIAMQGVRRANVSVGETIAVIGLGLIGQLTAQILKSSGCRVIGIDISRFPIKKVMESSIDTAINIKECNPIDVVNNFSKGYGVDKVIVTAGGNSSAPITLGAEISRDRATIVIVGGVPVDIPRDVFYYKEISIKFSRSYGPGRYDSSYEEKGVDYPIGYVRWTENRNIESFLNLIAEKKVNTNLINTHTFSLDDANQAYDLILKETEDFLGITIKYKNYKKVNKDNFIDQSKSTFSGDKISIGFIGLGNFAESFLLPSLIKQKNTQLITVSNQNGARLKNLMRKYNFQNCTTDSSSVFKNNSVNTIFIASRHSTHAKFLISAIENKKHVFIEKPIAINKEELKNILSSFKNLKTNIVMVGYNRRFAKASIVLKNKLVTHIRPLSILHRVNAGKVPITHWTQDPKEGGGRIIGEVCHFIDYSLFLTGSKVINVYASIIDSDQNDIPNHDSVHINLQFENGSNATIQYLSDGSRAVSKEWIEVIGDGKIYQIDNFKNCIYYHNNKKSKLYSGSIDKGYNKEIVEFINSIESKDKSPIGLNSILHGMEVTFGVLDSLKEKKVIHFDK